MIETIEIKHFKGLADVRIPGLSRVNLIGGRNNVGKTSLLEALFLIHDHNNPQMLLRQFAWRGVGSVQLLPESMWMPFFTDYDFDKPIQIVLRNEKKKKETLSLRLNLQYARKAIPAQLPDKSGFGREINTSQSAESSVALDIEYTFNGHEKRSAHLTLQPNMLGMDRDAPPINGQHQMVYLPSAQRAAPQEDAIRFGQLDIVGKQGVLVEFLHVIEPRLRGLSSVATGNTSMIYADIGLARKIPVPYTGDGMSRLLSIISAIATLENGVLLIDEVENGIHYSIMPKIWEGIAKAARQFNCQVFATTHSYECLTAAYQGCTGEYAADLGYVRLDKTEGNIVAKNYTHEMLGAAIERGWEVR